MLRDFTILCHLFSVVEREIKSLNLLSKTCGTRSPSSLTVKLLEINTF